MIVYHRSLVVVIVRSDRTRVALIIPERENKIKIKFYFYFRKQSQKQLLHNSHQLEQMPKGDEHRTWRRPAEEKRRESGRMDMAKSEEGHPEGC